MTKPDFERWGQNRLELLYYVEENQRAAFLAEALQDAYKQGYYAKSQEAWVASMEEEYADKEGGQG